MKETLNLKNVAEVLREKGADALRFLQDLADSGLTLSKDVLHVLAPLGLAASLAACGGESGTINSSGMNCDIVGTANVHDEPAVYNDGRNNIGSVSEASDPNVSPNTTEGTVVTNSDGQNIGNKFHFVTYTGPDGNPVSGWVFAGNVTCQATAPQAQEQQSAPNTSGYIEVLPGDTLSGIANRTGISMEELAKANGLTPPYTIYAGTSLKRP